MACTMLKNVYRVIRLNSRKEALPATWCRLSSSLHQELVDKHRTSTLGQNKECRPSDDSQKQVAQEPPKEYRDVYPDFLPNPTWWIRDKLTEKLEREDMYRRRGIIDIPEFYVGTIMAVTVADNYSPGKKIRFVGTCIYRGGHGLRSHFILRNVIDDDGVEVMYEMYSPVIQNIEVLRLEKRLDDELFYLRDAANEYSYVPQNIEPVQLPKGRAVPVNTTKVKLNPRPWLERWERKDVQGVQWESVDSRLTDKMRKQAEDRKEPWEKYDLMKQYRARINDVEAAEIFSELHSKQKAIFDRKKIPPKKS